VAKFVVSKTLGFDAGHRVTNHKSKCRSVHGHRYTLTVFVDGELSNAGSSEGMVEDFADIKSTMVRLIESVFDHAFIMWCNDDVLMTINTVETTTGTDGRMTLQQLWQSSKPKQFRHYRTEEFGNVVVMDKVPTAENLAELFFCILKDALTDATKSLVKIELWETPSSCAIVELQQ
jgi:6-pyruvoyltetrahydropterin/6-carboxytetrahydropterin synthase